MPQIVPTDVLVDVSSVCPHGCVYCYHQYYAKNTPKFMDADMFYKIVDILAKEGVTQIHPYMSGESLLHKNIWEFVTYIAEKKMHCSIASKFGMPIDWDAFEKAMLTFTENHRRFYWAAEVPGATSDVMKKVMTSGNPEQIWENLEKLGELFNKQEHTFKIGCKTVITRFNEHQKDEVKTKLAGMGLTSWRAVNPGFYMLYKAGVKLEEVEAMLPKNQLHRSRVDISKGVLKPHQKKGIQPKCGLCINPVVSPDGNVGLCCHDMLYEHNFGNILETGSLLEIVNSPTYIEHREKALVRGLDLCKGCN